MQNVSNMVLNQSPVADPCSCNVLMSPSFEFVR